MDVEVSPQDLPCLSSFHVSGPSSGSLLLLVNFPCEQLGSPLHGGDGLPPANSSTIFFTMQDIITMLQIFLLDSLTL